MAFNVKADGTLESGKVLYDATDTVGKMPGLPDGLSVDETRKYLGEWTWGHLDLQCNWQAIGKTQYGRTNQQLWFWRRRIDALHHRRLQFGPSQDQGEGAGFCKEEIGSIEIHLHDHLSPGT